MFHPLIGITCSEDYSADSFFIKNYYAKAVEAAGGVPVLLPSVTGAASRERFLEVLDGLILSGGVDVDPVFFDEEPLRGSGEITPGRDEFEIYFVREFFSLKKPIFAVCRGVQVLNIALGGGIYQDINTQVNGCLKHMQQAPKWHPTHGIEITEETLLKNILGEKKIRVNSFHHQAVSRAAPGFLVSARCFDGIIEGIEAENHPFALGVQWHPECCWNYDRGSFLLFQKLVSACRNI